jgi:hypothetical protein
LNRQIQTKSTDQPEQRHACYSQFSLNYQPVTKRFREAFIPHF